MRNRENVRTVSIPCKIIKWLKPNDECDTLIIGKKYKYVGVKLYKEKTIDTVPTKHRI